MNERMMTFGAIMYDAWWIMVLALALSGGIGVALQSLHPVWLAWVLGMAVALVVAVWGVRAMLGWHEQRERPRRHARCLRRIAQLERELRIGTPEQIARWDAVDAEMARWMDAMAYMVGGRPAKGGDDGE